MTPAIGTRCSGIGAAPKRREDRRFLTGQGRYLDDFTFERLVHAVELRSPHAHARIACIEARAARTMPGILAVLTAADAEADGLLPLRPYVEANTQTGDPFSFVPQPLLAANKVRYVGEPLAVAVGETREAALDAAEAVSVEYEPLPAIPDAMAARDPGAPLLAPEVPGNLCFEWRTGEPAAVEAAFSEAAQIVTLDIDNHRIGSHPMEPRGLVGLYDLGSSRYTLYISAQSLHATRDHAARARRRPGGHAVYRTRCWRRNRREELHLSRARADPVGGTAGRPAGQVDRQPQRDLSRRPLWP